MTQLDAPKLRMQRALATCGTAIVAITLVGCAAKPPPKIENIVVPIPPNVEAAPVEIPLPPVEPVPPELVSGSRGEDLWHLRSALNVAALLCDAKVHSSLIPDYNRMLKTHKTLLLAAAETELSQFKAIDKKKWQALADTHATKLYNQYSLTPQRARFCAKAVETVKAAAELPAEQLSVQATAMIFRLNLAGEIR